MTASLLVTGTDTGVGKTHIACGLVRGLVAAGVDVGVMKPCETGITPRWPPTDATASNAPVSLAVLPPGSDARALAEAADLAARAPDTDARDVLPSAFPLPAAPSVAAREAGERIDLDVLANAHARLAARHRCVVVEGAGGVAVPLRGTFTFLDLAERLDLAVVVVARARLGTLNHTALTVAAVRSRGLKLLGVVVNAAESNADRTPESRRADELNLSVLGELIEAEVMGPVPFGGPGSAQGSALVAMVRRGLDL